MAKNESNPVIMAAHPPSVMSQKRYSSVARQPPRSKKRFGIDIPGKDGPAGRSFVERVSEETLTRYASGREEEL